MVQELFRPGEAEEGVLVDVEDAPWFEAHWADVVTPGADRSADAADAAGASDGAGARRWDSG